MSIDSNYCPPAYAHHWESPWTAPIAPPPPSNYEGICKKAAIVAAVVAMVFLTIALSAAFTSALSFLDLPLLLIVVAAFIIFIVATLNEGRNNPPRYSTDYPAYRGFELRRMA